MKMSGGIIFACMLAVAASANERIGVRVVDGEGEFYNTVTGERFVARGVNYVDMQSHGWATFDSALATDVYDEGRIRTAFENLSGLGYNAVRLFFDICNVGSYCLTDEGRGGLNPAYLDNLAAFTRLADEYGIYLILTSNDIPDFGGYGEIANRDASDMFEGYRNTHFMTGSGVEAFEAYWTDLMAELAARDTAWNAVLGWSLLNEQWIFKDQPPWSLTSGVVQNGTGQSYDLSDPDQKRSLLADNLILITERVSAIIKGTDPDALVTMGFFNPQFPNATGIGGDWYVDTEPLLAGATLDFFDFHAYPDWDLPIDKIAENYGMLQHRDKPVIMGEVGSSAAFIPNIVTAVRAEQEWMVASCLEGFDGWLHWGYYAFPAGVDEHPPYTFDMAGRLFETALAPVNRPDACLDGDYIPRVNVALDAEASAQRSLPDHPPEYLNDGLPTTWESGSGPPVWVRLALAEPTRVEAVVAQLAQWPASDTRYAATVRLADGTRISLGEVAGYTQDQDLVRFDLPGGLDDVVEVQIDALESESWISYYNVDVLRAKEGPPACTVIADSAVNLRGDPSTANAPVGRLAAGWSMMAVSVEAVEGSPPWFHLSDGSYVRADVVAAGSACARLLE